MTADWAAGFVAWLRHCEFRFSPVARNLGGKSGKKITFGTYVVGSKSFRPDTQKPRQMENAVRVI